MTSTEPTWDPDGHLEHVYRRGRRLRARRRLFAGGGVLAAAAVVVTVVALVGTGTNNTRRITIAGTTGAQAGTRSPLSATGPAATGAAASSSTAVPSAASGGVPAGTPGGTSPADPGVTTTTTAPATATTRPPTTLPVRRGTIELTEANNGSTVTVVRGATIVVVLSNTYWTFAPAVTPSVLAMVGSPSDSASPPGAGGCVVGQGCGTVTATFAATGAGEAPIHASRTSCGEAKLCVPVGGPQSNYAVTVVVKG